MYFWKSKVKQVAEGETSMSEKVEKSPFKRVKQSIEELWDEFDW